LTKKSFTLPIQPSSATDQAFIQAHLNEDATKLLLKLPIAQRWLAEQIMARQKAKNKLPTWYNNPAVIFPVSLSVEQSSSETTAQHKASLMTGKLLIDATGGMGIDAFYFAKRFEKVIYIEQKPELVELARYNFKQLGATNIDCICGDSFLFLEALTQKADWIYLDPARRSITQKRVYQLADCEPDVTKNLDFLFQKTDTILVKTSPILDIKQAIENLSENMGAIAVRRSDLSDGLHAISVHVVAVENECKEVLFELAQNLREVLSLSKVSLNLQTTNYRSNLLQTQSFDFDLEIEQKTIVEFSNPLNFLYEPNVAVLKAGAFKSVGSRFGLSKIAPHSHLYTSDKLVNDFPGRTFEIVNTTKVDSQCLEPYLTNRKANLTVRNFPIGADELRKKLKLKDGGDVYLFATTLQNSDKRIIICRKP
jgi:16S rRNA G966 N2-methylase RsmD